MLHVFKSYKGTYCAFLIIFFKTLLKCRQTSDVCDFDLLLSIAVFILTNQRTKVYTAVLHLIHFWVDNCYQAKGVGSLRG
jgi:hypothetical protein